MSSEPSSSGTTASEQPPAERALGLLMKRVLQSITAQADRQLGAHDLTHAQWSPLLRLYRGECTTVAALARESDMDPGAMTRALDRLESKNLVQRVRSCTDRRVVNLALTPQGERVAQLVPGVLEDVIGAHLAGFAEAEVDALLNALNRMLDNGAALRSAAQDTGAVPARSDAQPPHAASPESTTGRFRLDSPPRGADDVSRRPRGPSGATP